MDNWLFISLFILLCSIWLWLHYSETQSTHKHKTLSPIKKQSKNYHGISLHLGSQACHCVCQLKEKRFLAREVPALPVYGCTNQACTCTYTHLADRRSGSDRRYPSLNMEGVFAQNEHRFKSDRRNHSFA